jgi:predicted sulfurtransferase
VVLDFKLSFRSRIAGYTAKYIVHMQPTVAPTQNPKPEAEIQNANEGQTNNRAVTEARKHKVVVLFYKYFLSETSPSILREHAEYYVKKLYQHQLEICFRLKLRGRVLLSSEGINGTVSAEDEETLEAYISAMNDFDLLGDCGTPNDANDSAVGSTEKSRLYASIDWKQSIVDDGTQEPFPDLKISVVKEIVSTGGSLKVDDISQHGGTHLSPQEFHDTLHQAENVVLIDVRNTFECEIGHFVNPRTQEPAINPQMVTFSSFDASFCAKQASNLKDKKVLMYCTGGIRCEKASAMLKKRGVEDVYQLEGGIHRYLEAFGSDESCFLGKNFVFDQRVALEPQRTGNTEGTTVVGTCIECTAAFDEISGSRICTVCRDLVLVCPSCQSKLREYHCRRHSGWKQWYFTFLEPFSRGELARQLDELTTIWEGLTPPSEHRNVRRTLNRQIQKVREKIETVAAGDAMPRKNALKRCRTCMETTNICDGRCFGFWKHRQVSEVNISEIDAPLPIKVGDRVEPGPHWNPLRLGEKFDGKGATKKGTVQETKSWATEGDENDALVVLWSHAEAQMTKRQIYRWGFVARNGQRMYDVQKAS